MRSVVRGGLLDRSPEEIESSKFAKEYVLEAVEPGAPKADPRFNGMTRKTWRLAMVGEVVELEAVFAADGHAEIVTLWLDRRWLNNRDELALAITLYGRFLRDAVGELPAADQKPFASMVAVPYDAIKSFHGFFASFPSTPRDGAGAMTDVFLGRRVDATLVIRNRGATVYARNDPSGRMCVGIATQSSALAFGSLLFAPPQRFTKREGQGVAGWRTVELEATPFGRRYGIDLDRAAPPKGRIARRYYGSTKIPRSLKLELLLEPTRGIAGVLLRIEQEWMEQSERNFFAGLELLSAFIAEGVGDTPDAPTRVEIGDFLSSGPEDADLFKVMLRELPFVAKGKLGAGLAVFVGEAAEGHASLEEGRVRVTLRENDDGWLDCLFVLEELREAVAESVR